MDFSLLVPTRNRPENVLRLMNSIVETTSDKNTVEILFYVDKDDIQTRDVESNIEERIRDKENITYKIMEDSSGKDWYNKWWNFLWENCSGQYIMQCGDDLVFYTQNWDIEVSNAFKEYEDSFVVVYCNDGSCDSKDRATHPFLTKDWCELLGYFVPGIFPAAYNDTWISDIAKGVNRFHYLENILIDHLHPDFNKSETDEVYEKQRKIAIESNVKDLYESTNPQREKDILKILYTIENLRITMDINKIYNSSYFLEQHHKAEQQAWDNGQLRYGDQCAALCYLFGLYDFDLIRNKLGFENNGLSIDPIIGVKSQLEKIRENSLRKPKHVVEVGAGRCEVSMALSHLGIKSTAIEPASCVFDLIKETTQKIGIEINENFHLINKRLEDCIDELEDFDSIVFIESLEHLEKKEFEKVFPKIKNILSKNSGLFIAVNWINYHPLIPNGIDHVMQIDEDFFDILSSESKEVLYRNGSHIVLQF